MNDLKFKINLFYVVCIMIQLPRHTEQCAYTGRTNRLMLYQELIAGYCKSYTKHAHTMRGKNMDFLMLNVTVQIVTAGF
jgi:hypothetical protein